jgi:uncharacterized protein
MLGGGQLLVSLAMTLAARSDCEEDEIAVSSTICAAPALTTRKQRESFSGRRKRSEAM